MCATGHSHSDNRSNYNNSDNEKEDANNDKSKENEVEVHPGVTLRP